MAANVKVDWQPDRGCGVTFRCLDCQFLFDVPDADGFCPRCRSGLMWPHSSLDPHGEDPQEQETPIKKTLSLLAAVAAVTVGSAHASTVVEAKKEIRRLWGPQAPRAYCIVNRESGWNPRAVSRTNDHGLFQLNGIHARGFGGLWARRYDPVTNVRMAFRLYRAAGFSPWNGGRWSC